MICIHYNIFAQPTFNIPTRKKHWVTIQQVHLKDSLAGSNKIKLGELSIAAIMVASVRKQKTLKKINFNNSLVI